MRWRVLISCVAALCLVGVAAGSAEAARRYDRSRSDTLLRGIVVGGVPVGGRDVAAATSTLTRLWEDPLDERVTLRVGEAEDSFTWRALGARTDVAAQIARARDAQQQLSLASRLWRRLTGSSFDRTFPVTRSLDEAHARAVLDDLAARTAVEPVDSSVDLSTGFVRLTDSRDGYRLDVDGALDALRSAVTTGSPLAELPGTVVEPKVRRSDHGTILLVRVGENRLYHYVGDRLVKTYTVATGQPRYPTPTGRFHVTLKRRSPTWINPAKRPGAWGANLPARIGPGPSNPLGLRALNINSPGIRIHGTSNTASLGYNASHGCIRMSNADVVELFERVGTGTPVFIIRAGSLKPLTDSDAPRTEGA